MVLLCRGRVKRIDRIREVARVAYTIHLGCCDKRCIEMSSPARVCGEVPARVCGDGGRGVGVIQRIYRRENVVRYEAGAFKIAGDAAVIDDHH